MSLDLIPTNPTTPELMTAPGPGTKLRGAGRFPWHRFFVSPYPLNSAVPRGPGKPGSLHEMLAGMMILSFPSAFVAGVMHYALSYQLGGLASMLLILATFAAVYLPLAYFMAPLDDRVLQKLKQSKHHPRVIAFARHCYADTGLDLTKKGTDFGFLTTLTNICNNFVQLEVAETAYQELLTDATQYLNTKAIIKNLNATRDTLRGSLQKSGPIPELVAHLDAQFQSLADQAEKIRQALNELEAVTNEACTEMAAEQQARELAHQARALTASLSIAGLAETPKEYHPQSKELAVYVKSCQRARTELAEYADN